MAQSLRGYAPVLQLVMHSRS